MSCKTYETLIKTIYILHLCSLLSIPIRLVFSVSRLPHNLMLEQGSRTYGSRARCGSFDDGIWLTWYFLNTIVGNEIFSVIFHLLDYKAISNIRSRTNSKEACY